MHHQLEAGDLLFIDGKEWSSRLIKFVLQSDISHVTIATGPNTICEVDLFEKMKIMTNPYGSYRWYSTKLGMWLTIVWKHNRRTST